VDLAEIGFYTLSDERALNTNDTSPMYRCEMILTDRCNFSCPYCRGLRQEFRGDLNYDVAMNTLGFWAQDRLKNVRFSGGEPLVYPYLLELVQYCARKHVEHIAVSSNGSLCDGFRLMDRVRKGLTPGGESVMLCQSPLLRPLRRALVQIVEISVPHDKMIAFPGFTYKGSRGRRAMISPITPAETSRVSVV
jgi:organic radical activating enzyme